MNPAIRQCIDRGGTVVTVTRRLARELRRLYDRKMVMDGHQSWESADILPWEAWLQRCHEQQTVESGQNPTPLTDPQCQLVWQDIVQRDISRHHAAEEPLWNIEATARAAVGSMRRMREWRISMDDLPPSRHPDHAGFRRWLRDFNAICEDNAWIDRYRLPDALVALGAVPGAGPLLVAGFDQLTTQQQHLLDFLSKRGMAVDVLSPDQGSSQDIPCHTYASAGDQWRAAAGWAVSHLADDPTIRLAIVVPDLAACRDDILAALTEVLAPDQVPNPGESRDLPFHISLGDPLDAHPLARELMGALEALTGDSMTLEAAEQLLISPVIGGYIDEAPARAAAALTLRRRLPWSLDIDDLLSELSSLGCPLLQDRLIRARGRVQTGPAIAPISTLSSIITTMIDDLGWPGKDMSLNSDQYQAREAIREQVLQLHSLEQVQGESNLPRAIALLGRALATKTFQPEAPDVSLEVLDIREAAGLRFDHVWFADLTGERWPPAPTPDPFIPVDVQRAAGCPDADVDLANALAARRHGRLAAATDDLVHSRPTHDGDAELIPSPLAGENADAASRPAPTATLALRVHASRAATDPASDDSGPPHPGGAVPGGTGLIQRQSVCPRSAFLRDRLGAGDHLFNRPGLDPARRGTLVHRVLDRVWRELGNSETLAQTESDALDAMISRAINDAGGRDRRVSGCGEKFFHIQQQWLLGTLRQWFALERARSATFEVVAREEKVALQLEALELQFKIDRIDRFSDGSLGLIDYKTGSGQSITDWFDERPREPQLPLYVLSQAGPEQPVSMVAFARVRLGECALDGLLDPERHPDASALGDHPGLKVTPPEKRRNVRDGFAHWEDHKPRWRDTLGGLARDFLAGDARINPGNGGLCPDCPTPAFCRSAGDVLMDDDQDTGHRDG